MTDPFETFMAAARRTASECGLTREEVEEAIGPLAASDPLARAADHERGPLLLLGKPGVGKTLAAQRWLVRPIFTPANWKADGNGYVWRFCPGDRRLIDPPWSATFCTAKSMSRIPQYESSAVEPLFVASRLVIDDLGQEYLDKTGFLVALIDEIMTERHRRHLPTVLTGNLNLDEFEKRYRGRVMDRVMQGGEQAWLVCTAESFRIHRQRVSVPPLVSRQAVVVRLDEIRAEKRAARDRLQADRQREQQHWNDEGKTVAAEIRELLRKTPKVAPAEMTTAEVEARKAQMAADLAKWRAELDGQAAAARQEPSA